MSTSIQYTRASSDEELTQILAIQKRNIKAHLQEGEDKIEGFITVGHDFEILKKMNDACPHILAKDGDTVAGYALVMLQSFRNEMPVLAPMFETADKLLKGKNYVVMGQVCIDKPYRKMGIFKSMYAYYKDQLSSIYDCLFTEVATANKRSLGAHQSVGFKVLDTQITDGTSWELVNWDW
ncbi:GNAT family N-acetyltransferase [Spongiimicrobium salis]|uniref:GNAT family N-acetyltransferase n=1 Tax=Spongiimicrobium salis TaxID=1667022 RepID=UPI00374D7F0B